MSDAVHAALGDCEALVSSALGAWQPANTLSSLAFIAAGVWVLRRTRPATLDERRFAAALAAALVAVGVGSAAFHGLGTSTARWAHDVSILALLLVVLARGASVLRGDARPLDLVPAALAVVAAVVVLAPAASVPLSAVVAAVAVAVETAVALRSRRPGRLGSGRYRLAVGALVVGAVVDVLSRTGAPWCQPASLLQGHAAWHVAAAAAGAAWGAAVLRPSPRAAGVSDRRRG